MSKDNAYPRNLEYWIERAGSNQPVTKLEVAQAMKDVYGPNYKYKPSKRNEPKFVIDDNNNVVHKAWTNKQLLLDMLDNITVAPRPVEHMKEHIQSSPLEYLRSTKEQYVKRINALLEEFEAKVGTTFELTCENNRIQITGKVEY